MEDLWKPTLNETASPVTRLRTQLLLGSGILPLVLLALMESDIALRAVYLVWAGTLLMLALLVPLLSPRRRCIMCPVGIELGKQYLAWRDVRTAAVIRRGSRPPILCRFPDEQHFILLSVLPPEEAIDKWHFRMEAATPGQELRIPYTRRRAEAIGHYLHMTLPEYRT